MDSNNDMSVNMGIDALGGIDNNLTNPLSLLFKGKELLVEMMIKAIDLAQDTFKSSDDQFSALVDQSNPILEMFQSQLDNSDISLEQRELIHKSLENVLKMNHDTCRDNNLRKKEIWSFIVTLASITLQVLIAFIVGLLLLADQNNRSVDEGFD